MNIYTLELHTLQYKNGRTYLIASFFIIGNILLPQLCHLIPQGGLILLPIYFFTLIGAYKYGWKVGLLTAIFSPLLNHLLFEMPSLSILPAILLKSILLAFIAGFAAHYYKRISIPILLGVVLTYQIIGTLGEWLLEGNLYKALQGFRLAIPGMLTQIFGGYLLICKVLRR
ncbi:MAG: ECF transporter S component [Prevotella sp.]|jgi:hypothetical protein|nr:ECF transporter S component [Prevotella sp.]